MSWDEKHIVLDKDPRFNNPFFNNENKFVDWIASQNEVIDYYTYLHTNAYTFSVDDNEHKYLLDVYKEFAKTNKVRQEIYVFGSNLAGVHGAGAALHAKIYQGAVTGRGVGRMGVSYGIPTKDEQLEVLSLDVVEKHIEDFVKYTQQHPEFDYFVTRVGCGLAGYKDEQISQLFIKHLGSVPEYVLLPYKWHNDVERVIFAGSRQLKWNEIKEDVEQTLLKTVDENSKVIVGGAWGVDRIAESLALKHGYAVERVPAKWEVYGRSAGYVRNYRMANKANSLKAFMVNESRGTASMVEEARHRNFDVYLKIY